MPGRQFYMHRSPDVEKRARLVIQIWKRLAYISLFLNYGRISASPRELPNILRPGPPNRIFFTADIPSKRRAIVAAPLLQDQLSPCM